MMRPTSPKSVLVIEDDDAQRQYLAQLLRAEGYRVEEAPDCEQALALLRDSPTPDAVLLDWVLPACPAGSSCASCGATRTWPPSPWPWSRASPRRPGRAACSAAPRSCP